MESQQRNPSTIVASLSAYKVASEFVQNVIDETSNHFLLTLSAPPGFGRTLVARSLWSDYQKPLAASFVAVRDYLSDGEIALSRLLKIIIQNLIEALPTKHLSGVENYEIVEDRDELGDIIKTLVNRIAEYVNEKKTLLIFDDFDCIPNDEIFWLKANLLTPLAITRKVVFIFTTEGKLRFEDENDFVLHTSMENIELSNVDAAGIAEAFPEYKTIADKMFSITGGLITLVRAFIELLQTSRIEPESFLANEQQILHVFYQTHARRIVFEGLEDQLHDIILTLSLLRRFDVKILPGLISSIRSDETTEFGTIESLNLIDRFGARVCWRKQGGYTIAEPLRLALIGFVCTERKELFYKTHNVMVSLYRNLLADKYREPYLVELLYHSLNILPDKELSKAKDTLGKDLLTILDGDLAIPFESVDFDFLQQTLSNDPDLQNYISSNVILYMKTQAKVLGLEERLNKHYTPTLNKPKSN